MTSTTGGEVRFSGLLASALQVEGSPEEAAGVVARADG